MILDNRLEDKAPLCVLITRSKFTELSSLHSSFIAVDEGSFVRSNNRSIEGLFSNTGLEYDHVSTEIEAPGSCFFKL